ncbi:GPI14 GPI mannosyltransferase 1 [Candida maltosa Xu316]
MPVKYTDIDYLVFNDAATFVYNGESPYLRETYRYTPILAFLLLPDNFGGNWYHFGKILFMVSDVITGVIILKLLSKQLSNRKTIILSSIWLLNPMVITISTRGSAESVLTVMIMLSLYYLLDKQCVILSAFWLGLSIHFKIYPIIYLPSILYYLSTQSSPFINFPIINLINKKNLTYLIVTTITLAAINYLMFFQYGWEFIENSYLYHFSRLDHRHNFSVYNMALYYKSALSNTLTGLDIEKLAFIPQLALSGVIIPLVFAQKDLISSLFIQTFVFVTFNKVITSQYFIWFLIFLPHFLSKTSLMTTNKVSGVVCLLLWIVSQATWLYFAYKLEFLGENTFDNGLLYSSIFFFLTMELYSPEGLRIDGRRWNELRRFECRINTHPNSSDGSSYVEQGNTKVMCTVQGPVEPTLRSQQHSEHANVEVNLTIANFATFERKKRNKNEKRLIELKNLLEKTFEESIMINLYPRTNIIINVQVLSQDGGMLAAVANAITLAVIDAGIAMYDYVSSICCGLYDTTPLLDLNNLEENDMSSLTIGVIGKSEKLALLLLEDKMPLDRLENILSIGIAGSHKIRELMDQEVRKHGNLRASKMMK